MSTLRANTLKPITSGNSLVLQGDSGGSGVTGIEIDSTGKSDFNGKELILDADGDTSITADTDDQIDFRAGGSDSVKIGNEHLTINDGNLVIGTAGHGITFQDTDSSNDSSTSNEAYTLDSYETGTFTAGLVASTSTTITLSDDLMSYTKIGNRVWVSGRVIISTMPSASSSEFYITGLPFTIVNASVNENGSAGSVTYYDLSAGAYLSTPIANVDGKVSGYTDRWRMFKTNSSMGNGDQISFSLTYLTS